MIDLRHGDCLEVLRTLPDASVDAVITDPPYALTGASRGGSPRINNPATPFGRHNLQPKGFMGLQWDGALPPLECWQLCLRALKPGGYLLAMGGTRTYHRLACAVEDAGFEIRDCLLWLYGTGFPKGKGCLKPAYEPILLARKPGPRVLPLGIEECRIPLGDEQAPRGSGDRRGGAIYAQDEWTRTQMANGGSVTPEAGRYPANLAHDGSPEVLGAFAAFGTSGSNWRANKGAGLSYSKRRGPEGARGVDDTGTAARFFFCAKASKRERGEGNTHPTVKPLALMRWLVRLVCPAGGVVLDPFTGSGTTSVACVREGRGFVGVERDAAYLKVARRRVAQAEAAAATA